MLLMKKIMLLPCIVLYQFCLAQGNETVTFINKKGEEVKEKKASFLIERLRINGKWEINTYEIMGPMLNSVQAKDENGAIKNGRYISYQNGYIDTLGFFNNNRKDSIWKIYTAGDHNAMVKELIYKNDKLIAEKDSTEVYSEIKKASDSLNANFTFAKVEIESSYVGGDRGWQQFLVKNFRYPDRAVSNEIQGQVIVMFVVTKEGKVEDAIVEKSAEYSLDTEALRVLRKSSDWVAAEQNGRKVKSYKRQPFIFKLVEQRSK
jgi:TonB family protein